MGTIDDRVSLANANRAKKLLNDGNFEVLDVAKCEDPTGKINTVVKVRIDLFPNSPSAVPDNRRYVTRNIRVKRVDILDALKRTGFELDEKGRIKLTEAVTTAEAFNQAIAEKVNISPDEFTFRAYGEGVAVIKVKETSLGYYGKVTVVSDSSEPTGKSPRMIYTQKQFELMDAVRDGRFIIPPELGMNMDNLGKNSDVEFINLTETNMDVLWKEPDAAKWLPSFYVIDEIKTIDDIADDATVTIEYVNGDGEPMTVPWGSFKYTASPYQDAVYMFSSMSQTSVIQSPVTVTIAGKMTDGTDIVTKPVTLTWSLTTAGGPALRMAKPVGNRVLEAYNNMKSALALRDSN